MSGIVVQKFGGTSVGSGERIKAVARIVSDTARTNPVIAVVSAISPEKKANGTTSLLLKAAEASVEGKPFREMLDLIKANHEDAISTVISSETLAKEACSFVSAELERVACFLDAISVIKEMSPTSMDHVVSAGEKLSAFLLAHALSDAGTEAEYVDLSDVVPACDECSNGGFFDKVQEALVKRCEDKVNRVVPVLTGFFGPVPGGIIERVGRGYTDFTAAMVAAGFGNGETKELQVWKEVDGICTADPRRVESAKLLTEISAVEASELTHFGSEVLHPFTMERVTSARVPIRVKNTFKPDGPGTCVHARPPEHSHPVSAITAKKGITVLTLTSNRMYNTYGFLAKTFSILRDHGVVVDLVSTSEVSISFTVEQGANIESAQRELEKLGQVEVRSKSAILAAVGENMKSEVGTAARFLSALAQSGIRVSMISKGASQVNISCVIAENDVDQALPCVHDAFFE